MAASYSEIKGWFKEAERKGCTHLVVVCDTFDHEDYPVYCESKEEAEKKVGNPGDMQRVMEVYRIDLGWETQSNGRAHNL